MSKVVSLRLKDELAERLVRLARRQDRTPAETAARLIDESLRRNDFAFVDFRDSPVGRQAYVQSTRLAVWQVVSLHRHHGGDPAATSAHLGVPVAQVEAALRYAEAYPDELAFALSDATRSLADLRRLIPTLEVVEVDAPPA